MRRLTFRLIAGALALALTGSAYVLLNRPSSMSGSAAQGAGAKGQFAKIVTVEASRVKVDTVFDTVQAVGSLLPNESVTISSEIVGRIAKLPFDEGDRVKAGEALVLLDDTILKAELAKAQSDLSLAQANRDRAMSLATRGTGTLRARDEAVAAYQAASANVALAQARLEKATIVAPLTGVVGIRSVSVGAYVSPGERIVGLADVDIIKTDFRVPELLLAKLKTGQSIRVSVDALPGEVFEGKIYVIDPIVDANGRAIRLRARIANTSGKLAPGLFARVQIVVERRENAILVPEAAIFSIRDERFVYQVQDGRAVQTKVVLGQRQPGWVEILSGLSAGAVVVTAGQQQLNDGTRVTSAPPAEGT